MTRADLDVSSKDDVRRALEATRPAVVVNCSAYTNVDGAEDDPVAALAVNAWGAGLLAAASEAVGATFVHFSTDFVFDGRATRPYTEDDRANPQSAYAASKLLGEWLAADASRHYVLRVESLFGGRRAQSSIDRILASLRAGGPVRAFVDRSVSPSYVDDVVTATVRLVDERAPFGLYHCVNTGWTNWSALAREIARLIGRPDAVVEDVHLADAGLRAVRPKFAALSNARLASVGITLPTWQDALARHVACT